MQREEPMTISSVDVARAAVAEMALLQGEYPLATGSNEAVMATRRKSNMLVTNSS